MADIPRDRVPESSISFMADPYRFIGRRAQELGSDVFATRLLGQRTICMYGRQAGALFYDTSRMRRAGAMPLRVVSTLLGAGGVQALDGQMHRLRKAMFLELATGARIDALLQLAADAWDAHARRWQDAGGVCLYEGATALLAEAAFAWVGIPLTPAQVQERRPDVVALFDGAGAVGPRHWRSRLARRRLESWLADVVTEVREGVLACDSSSPLARVVAHVDADGSRLDARVAAVELLNLVRPIVAVSVYVTFLAHALHRHPGQRGRVAAGGRELENFVQEVRRFYPFFPAAAARTCKAFSWNGFEFPQGTRVMFDLYGTNHDPRHWQRPDTFNPVRFNGEVDQVFGLVPQGGGSHAQGHRCPGEWITVALMQQAAQFLARLRYQVEGDPQIQFSRLPALPEGGMQLRQVQRGD